MMSTPVQEQALGARLRTRREDLGASTAMAAVWAEISPSRLSEIEDGDPMLPWEYEAACRALAVDSGALARGLDSSPKRSIARFRTAGLVDPEPSDLRLLALAGELSRIGGHLASRLGRTISIARHRKPTPITAGREIWRQGYRLGEAARRALIQSAGPVTDFEAALCQRGVHVARISFSSPSVDAASLWETDALPIILLNDRSSRVRSSLSRRALLAHELCHLLHDAGEHDLTTQLTWSEGKGNWQTDTEQRARAFAPAFLAPSEEVRHWFRAGEGRNLRKPADKVLALARRWGFSLDGAVWHAKNCELISARKADELHREQRPVQHEWEEQFEPKDEPHGARRGSFEWEAEISAISNGLFADLVVEAAIEGIISEGRAREILTWD